MEMKQEINKYNFNKRHGYWKNNLGKRHLYNGNRVGYHVSQNAFVQCHYKNGRRIGCAIINHEQLFYNKSGKKFGEQIIWK